ncbi:hypothetical protein ABIE13_001487 [Ottowia thiooxydans]|uniref:Uncharacterized protein n=1 Tax=Ottowia thiooxydans TaxID=219182 RepID=A0ABV2Q6A0_9BURK
MTVPSSTLAFSVVCKGRIAKLELGAPRKYPPLLYRNLESLSILSKCTKALPAVPPWDRRAPARHLLAFSERRMPSRSSAVPANTVLSWVEASEAKASSANAPRPSGLSPGIAKLQRGNF